MTQFDPAQPPEVRIQQAIANGPDMSAQGRFGALTRIARTLVGRAVKYERDFNLQIDVALLDKLHEIETTANEQLHQTDERLRDAHDELRVANQELDEANRRLLRETFGLQDRINALEETVKELEQRFHDVDTRSAIANTMA